MIPEESRELFRYVTKVRHDKCTNRVYMPDYIIGMLISYSQVSHIPLLEPDQLVMFGVLRRLHYEHAVAWVWLCENLSMYIEGLERGIITYSPN